jgi:integrase/recombinase XerD
MFYRRKKLPSVLNADEASKLLSIPNPRYPTGLRNLAIISVMLNLGLRVSEVSNLKPGNINLTEGKLRVVNGKGGVDRDIIIPNGFTTEILKRWKKIKPKAEYFFTTLKGGKVSSRYMHLFVKRYAHKAVIDKNVSPHTLRHTFATEFYRQTKDLETLRLILGHSSVSTTQIYITLANTDVEAAMNGFKQFGG